MPRIRNLIIGCDGTWNDVASGRTNVAKILDACSARNQRQHYEEGVGTAHLEALPGGLYGQGLDRQILGSYRFLRKRFADEDWAADENKIFIYGFSRGAYAARRLAGLINHSGIPTRSKDVDLGWQLYLKRDHDSVKALIKEGRFLGHSIEVLGVWDTVKMTTDEDYNDNKLPANVVAGYHAMAIDERRKLFRAVRWTSSAKVRQVWFAGVHSDVGGGYPRPGLSDIALKWMIDSSHGHGLVFKASEVKKVKPNPDGIIHESFDGFWKALGQKKRTLADSALVHSSVEERLNGDLGYAPGNLPGTPVYVKW